MPFHFSAEAYGPIVADLLRSSRVPELGPGSPNLAARDSLLCFDPLTDLGSPIRDPGMATACLAGLWLLHDFLDESHRISQDLPTAEGSFWHAIMHRREPDAWNSKYWWRKVGPHPVIEQLLAESPRLGYDYTSPSAFVDFCEKVRGSGSVKEELAKQVQLLEWRLLFDHCYRASG